MVTNALHLTGGRIHVTIYAWPVAAAAVGLRYFGIAVLVLGHEFRRHQRTWHAEQVFQLPLRTRLLQLRLAALGKAAVVAWLLVWLTAVNDHVMPRMFLVHTYTTQVLIEAQALLNPAGATGLALPVVAVGAVITLLALRFGRTAWVGEADSAPPTGIAPRAVAQLAAAVLVVAVAVVAPLAAIASRCGSFAAVVASFGATKAELRHTLWLAVAGGLLCALLGTVLAQRWLARRRQRRASIVPLVALGLLAPASLLGLGLIELGQYAPLAFVRDSPWLLVVGYVVRFVPVATFLCYAAWRNESALAERAARVHGCSPLRTFMSITWPRRRGVALSCAALCALLIATELDLSVLLVPPGTTTLGVRLHTLMHTAPDAQVSAAAMSIVLLVVLAIGLWLAVASWCRRQTGGRQP